MISRFMLAGFAAAALLTGANAASGQEVLREQMFRNHVACDRGDRAACVRFGILIGQNRERETEWRRTHPEWWWWSR
jgi:hypothetical protein